VNGHAILDRITAAAAAIGMGGNRFFDRRHDGTPIAEVTRCVALDPLILSGTGTHGVVASTPAGRLAAAYHVARWRGPGHPALVYLHGSGERPFDFSRSAKNTFRTVVLAADPGWDENLLVVRAPFHDGAPRDYARAMGDMANFTAMIATMVVLTERLTEALRAAGCGSVTVAGISLGGWATNLHAGCFGTADAYIPMLAGAALDDTFLRSAYARLTAAPALRDPVGVQRALNFESAFRDAPMDRVFPLLARHDQFIRHEAQAASYGGVPFSMIERGHVTAALSPGLLREHTRAHRPAVTPA
jgi:hypothetical protein